MVMFLSIVLLSGCNKEKEKDPTTSNSTEGIYLGIIGFNSELYIKPISLLDNSTASSFTQFITGLHPGNGTGLYYADYMALKKMSEFSAPPKLKNIALVTFTDGLDNVSTASSEYDPENYGSTSAYREALHNKIVNEKIHGLNISAYTIGLKGNDVSDNAVFVETLKKLASSDNNVFQVSNMNEAMQRFNEIAANLYSVSVSVNLGVNVPGGYDEGQILRFTFDNASSATASNRYIEATYSRSSNSRTLKNIKYHGFSQGSTTLSSSSSQGAYYQFQFNDLKYSDGSSVTQSDLNKIMLWKKTTTGNWDRESEFNPATSSTVTEDKNSALIVLVLDCTTSLGSDFSKMQQAGKIFVNTLANPDSGNTGYTDLGLPSRTLWKNNNETGFYIYDEAVSQFGNRLPTKQQWEELKAECQWSWNGSGFKVTGPNGNSIVLPASGLRHCDGSVDGVGSGGYYWSSTPGDSDDAWRLFFGSGGVLVGLNYRCSGHSVRLVQD